MNEPLDFKNDARGVWKRRLISIPAYTLIGSLFLATLPLMLILAGIRDIVQRTRGAAVRALLFLTWYFLCELVGVAFSFVFWLLKTLWPGVTRAKYLRWNFTLQSYWTKALFEFARWVFQFRLSFKNMETGKEGPYLLFVRHASMADTVLASSLLSHPYQICLRYVMKEELLWDPCLNIVGLRLANVFVRRGSKQRDKELKRVAQLATNLGHEDGVLIYPEGTRFTTSKQQRLLDRFKEKGDMESYKYAKELDCVLPPRLGGATVLMNKAPDVDVVFFAHTGFEHVRTLWDVWNGGLIQQHIQIELWRVPASDIPKEEKAREQWLLAQWQRVAEWVQEHQDPPSAKS